MVLIDDCSRGIKRVASPGIPKTFSAASLCLSLALSAFAGPGELQLPDRSVTGKGGGNHSSYDDTRNRSRAIINFKIKVKHRNPNVAVTFADESVLPGAQLQMYPDGAGYPLPSMTDIQSKDGKFSLELTLKADAYSGGAVCSPNPLDLTRYTDKGMLEFWVKGASGNEIFLIGLLDNGSNPLGRPLQVSVSSRSFSKVLKDDWRRIRVPLKAFGARGSYWSDDANARISSSLNWSAISCFSVDIDKNVAPTFKIWLDDVTIYKKMPKDSQAGGHGYSLSNEDFDDFPKENGK
jgi:hypothetical protein